MFTAAGQELCCLTYVFLVDNVGGKEGGSPMEVGIAFETPTERACAKSSESVEYWCKSSRKMQPISVASKVSIL